MEKKNKIIITVAVIIVGFFIIANLLPIIWPEEEYELLARSEAIPSDATKMTPSQDDNPPQLAVAFSSMYHDPKPLEGPINTAGAEDSPFITPDGKTFFFWFSPTIKAASESINDGSTGIYTTSYDGSSWSEPKRVFTGWDVLDGCPTYHDGKLFFCSARKNVEMQMYVADYDGTDLSDGDLTSLEEYTGQSGIGELHVIDDGNTIVYSSKCSSEQDYDLYRIERKNAVWQDPVAIEGINTDDAENQPFVSQDGKELWFTKQEISGGELGAPAVYRSKWDGNQWESPALVVSSLAGEPTLDGEGNLYFVHHYWDNDANSMIEADIYVCYKK